jgi:hypothetical protein
MLTRELQDVNRIETGLTARRVGTLGVQQQHSAGTADKEYKVN